MGTRVFCKVLIAQPGEATLRVARSCKHLDIITVGLASPQPAAEAYLDSCDESMPLPASALETDDSASALVEHALQAGVDGIHPGYASQVPSSTLARACEEKKIPLIGPSSTLIERVNQRNTVSECAAATGLRPSGTESAAQARLMEVLVASDRQGEAVPISDREWSLTRQSHRLIEEAPTPTVALWSDGEAFREFLYDAAIRVANELSVAGLLSVGFEVDAAGRAFLCSISPGLPIQHTLIEMITGLDIVALELRLAAGEAIPEEVRFLSISGHAFAASVRTSSAGDESAPIGELRWPAAPQRQVRVEPAVMPGCPSPTVEDALIAKITTCAPIRHRALLTLDRMLADFRAPPLETNAAELRQALAHKSFRAGQYDSSLFS